MPSEICGWCGHKMVLPGHKSCLSTTNLVTHYGQVAYLVSIECLIEPARLSKMAYRLPQKLQAHKTKKSELDLLALRLCRR